MAGCQTFALPAAGKALAKLDAGVNKLLSPVISVMKDLAISTQVSEKAFMRQTGASQEMASGIRTAHIELRGLGVTAESAGATMNALYNTTTDFTMASKSMRESLVETGAVLGQLGVAEQDFAQGLQNSTKMFGQSQEQAEATSRELVAHAKDLGVSVGALAQQYASMGPQLAKFGQQGTKAFKDLAHISKITGMEMSKVLGIANKFDTFEDAAGMAGKLNAALGGNFVNAMDMMMETDPAARFGMVRDAITDAGLSFDDMSYYQKQFYTESLGLSDVGDLAQMLSGDMEGLSGDMGKSSDDLIAMKEAAQENQNIMEQWQALLREASPVLIEIVDGLSAVLKVLQKNVWILKSAIVALFAFKGVMILAKVSLVAFNVVLGVLKLLQSAQLAKTMAQTTAQLAGTTATIADTTAKGAQATVTGALTTAQTAQAASTAAVGTASTGAAPAILAVAAAMLALGVGIAIAAVGVAVMVVSFKDLGESAKWAAAGIALLMIPFLALMALAYAVIAGPQAAITTGVVAFFLSLAAAAVMLGAGIMLAALGISVLILAFKELFTIMPITDFFIFTTILVGLYLAFSVLGVLAPLAALGMMAFAGGMLAIGLALATLMPTMLIFDRFTDSILALVGQQSGLAQIAKEFKEIGKAIDEMPAVKTVALTALMATTAATTVAAGVPGALAGAVAGAIGGTPGGGGATGGGREVKVQINLDRGATQDFLSGKTKTFIGKESFKALG